MDLSTKYMGLNLKNPIIPGASPLTAKLDTLQQMTEAGAAAFVLHSLFEEQIVHEQEELHYHTTHGTEFYAEMTSFFPEPDEYRLGPEEYLKHIEQAKAKTGLPIIASLNGTTVGGWTEYAKKMADAGADGIELNVYYIATDPSRDGAAVEQLYLDILKAVKGAVQVPVAMKLSPYFSATAHMCKQLDAAGADALVLFNRFYQPDINLEDLEVVPDLVLSTPFETRLPLRWVAVLYGNVECSLSATSGVVSGTDAIKLVMAGADTVQVVSTLLRKGPQEVANLLQEMTRWMEENEYESIQQMKGSLSQQASPDPAAFERANYMKTLNSYA